MRYLYFSTAWTVIIDIIAWFLVHMGISFISTKLPVRMFDPSHLIYRSPDPLLEKKFYEQSLHIRRWKQKLPDAAVWFSGGFAKKNLSAKDPAYIQRFIAETCRGEFAHWLTILCSALFFLWNEPAVGWLMVCYALFANLPCIFVQRYNRIRLSDSKLKV